MKLSMLAGSTSQTVNVFVRDSSSTTGGGLTGLAYNTASLVAYYCLPRTAAVAITLATQTATGAWSSGGFVEISSTNMPGWYRLDLPNAVIAASSGRFVSLLLKGATNMAPCPVEIELTGWDNQDATRGGLTALPNAAANANGGLPILSSSGTTLAYTVSTLTTYTGNTVQTGDSYAVVNSATFGNAKLVRSTTPANTLDVSATGEAGVDWANVGSPTTTLALTGTTISTSQAVASVAGSVGSVTGAVGSVTGSVGSVAGSVGGTVTLAAAGLDSVVIETGLNARQALALGTAVLAGVASGMGTTTGVFKGAGVATTRVTATQDASGNRSALTLNPPA